MKQTTNSAVIALVTLTLVTHSALAQSAKPKAEGPPAEYGFSLTPADALDGWISLFDGETTFGWTSESKADGGLLKGGATSDAFGNYEIKANVAATGKITVGKDHVMILPAGEVHGKVEGFGRGPIRLENDLALRSISIRPMGTKSVFDGESFEGWKRIQRTKPDEKPAAKWSISDGFMRAVGGPEAMELVDSNYGDLVLQLTIMTRKAQANGGVFFRAISGDFMNGYEAQIHNVVTKNEPGGLLHVGTGGIDDRQTARRLVSRDGVPFAMTIIALGPRIRTWVNGYQMTDWVDTRAASKNPRDGLRVEPGAVQLQAHDPATDLEFRNIRVREL